MALQWRSCTPFERLFAAANIRLAVAVWFPREPLGGGGEVVAGDSHHQRFSPARVREALLWSWRQSISSAAGLRQDGAGEYQMALNLGEKKGEDGLQFQHQQWRGREPDDEDVSYSTPLTQRLWNELHRDDAVAGDDDDGGGGGGTGKSGNVPFSVSRATLLLAQDPAEKGVGAEELGDPVVAGVILNLNHAIIDGVTLVELLARFSLSLDNPRVLMQPPPEYPLPLPFDIKAAERDVAHDLIPLPGAALSTREALGDFRASAEATGSATCLHLSVPADLLVAVRQHSNSGSGSRASVTGLLAAAWMLALAKVWFSRPENEDRDVCVISISLLVNVRPDLGSSAENFQLAIGTVTIGQEITRSAASDYATDRWYQLASSATADLRTRIARGEHLLQAECLAEGKFGDGAPSATLELSNLGVVELGGVSFESRFGQRFDGFDGVSVFSHSTKSRDGRVGKEGLALSATVGSGIRPDLVKRCLDHILALFQCGRRHHEIKLLGPLVVAAPSGSGNGSAESESESESAAESGVGGAAAGGADMGGDCAAAAAPLSVWWADRVVIALPVPFRIAELRALNMCLQVLHPSVAFRYAYASDERRWHRFTSDYPVDDLRVMAVPPGLSAKQRAKLARDVTFLQGREVRVVDGGARALQMTYFQPAVNRKDGDGDGERGPADCGLVTVAVNHLAADGFSVGQLAKTLLVCAGLLIHARKPAASGGSSGIALKRDPDGESSSLPGSLAVQSALRGAMRGVKPPVLDSHQVAASLRAIQLGNSTFPAENIERATLAILTSLWDRQREAGSFVAFSEVLDRYAKSGARRARPLHYWKALLASHPVFALPTDVPLDESTEYCGEGFGMDIVTAPLLSPLDWGQFSEKYSAARPGSLVEQGVSRSHLLIAVALLWLREITGMSRGVLPLWLKGRPLGLETSDGGTVALPDVSKTVGFFATDSFEAFEIGECVEDTAKRVSETVQAIPNDGVDFSTLLSSGSAEERRVFSEFQKHWIHVNVYSSKEFTTTAEEPLLAVPDMKVALADDIHGRMAPGENMPVLGKDDRSVRFHLTYADNVGLVAYVWYPTRHYRRTSIEQYTGLLRDLFQLEVKSEHSTSKQRAKL